MIRGYKFVKTTEERKEYIDSITDFEDWFRYRNVLKYFRKFFDSVSSNKFIVGRYYRSPAESINILLMVKKVNDLVNVIDIKDKMLKECENPGKNWLKYGIVFCSEPAIDGAFFMYVKSIGMSIFGVCYSLVRYGDLDNKYVSMIVKDILIDPSNQENWDNLSGFVKTYCSKTKRLELSEEAKFWYPEF